MIQWHGPDKKLLGEDFKLDLEFFDLQIIDDVWVPLLATIIGGALALCGSFGATVMANRSAKKTRLEEQERSEAESAYTVFFKLFDGHNLAANLKRQIDEMFDTADATGSSEMEPWAKVMEIVGSTRSIESIAPSETAFLIREKKADLLNEIHLVQERLASILASAQKYNQLRTELGDFLEANLSEGKVGEGTKLSAPFEGTMKLRAELRECRINNLLGQIMENLEQDIPRSWEILEEFKEAASERYGDNFPEFRIERVLKPL
ncbi:MAG: hypothetical protein HWE35_02755 [Rhodobacteraceae bacterium]|nr:hypothetical protein [Paracoccaceae bacterium]